jgi:hypothetical protein
MKQLVSTTDMMNPSLAVGNGIGPFRHHIHKGGQHHLPNEWMSKLHIQLRRTTVLDIKVEVVLVVVGGVFHPAVEVEEDEGITIVKVVGGRNITRSSNIVDGNAHEVTMSRDDVIEVNDIITTLLNSSVYQKFRQSLIINI